MRSMLTGTLALFLGACGGDAAAPEPEPIRLEFPVPSVAVPVGSQIRLEVRALDPRGSNVPSPAPAWTSEAPEVAAVDGTGLVRGIQRGVTRISAAAGESKATVEVRVVAAHLRLATSPGSRTLLPGSSLQAFAHVADAQDNPIGSARPFVSWSSGDPTIASVSPIPGGETWVKPGRPGTTEIVATLDGLKASVPVTVLGPLTKPTGSLEIVEFRILELQYPGGFWSYVPLVKVREAAGGMVDILRMALVLPSAPAETPVCASLRILPRETRDLVRELYGDWQLSFDLNGPRAPAGDFHLVIWYNTADGMEAVEAASRAEAGWWPTSYSGGEGWWGSCLPWAGGAAPMARGGQEP